MRRTTKCHLILLLAVSALTQTVYAADADENSNVAKVCVDTNRVHDFDPLSDNYLFIKQGSADFFLLTMRSRCFNLRNARVIAFKDGLRRVCAGENFAEIVIRDMGRPTSCRIGNVEKVADKDAAKALVEEREQATSGNTD